MPYGDHILQEIPVPISEKKEFFEKGIKYEVEVSRIRANNIIIFNDHRYSTRRIKPVRF
jgi:hypothetical protein